MTEKMTLYRPLPRRPFRAVTSKELFEGIHYRVPCPEAETDSSVCPIGEWYCENTWCVVRQVTISCKLYGEKLPTMKCPACRSKMKFQHWLCGETLVPYEG